MRSSEYLGRLMWKAEREEDRDAAERTIKQQQFASPITSSTDEVPPLDLYDVAARVIRGSDGTQQGIVPDGHDIVTIGTDLRKTQLHWVAIAWQPDATSRVIDYGIYKVPSRKYGEEVALRWALGQMRSVLRAGFKSESGKQVNVDQWWIDVGWKPDPIYKFIRESKKDEFWDKHIYPYLGRGIGPQYKGNYNHPTSLGKTVVGIIDEAHKRYHVNQRCAYWMVNADHYKLFVHDRFRVPVYIHDEDDQGNLLPIQDFDKAELNAGAMSLFIPRRSDHLEFCRHILAEQQKTVMTGDHAMDVERDAKRVHPRHVDAGRRR